MSKNYIKNVPQSLFYIELKFQNIKTVKKNLQITNLPIIISNKVDFT